MTHVKIHGRGKTYDVGGGKQFDTIEDLIEYYKKCLLVDDKGTAIYLYQVCYQFCYKLQKYTYTCTLPLIVNVYTKKLDICLRVYYRIRS